MMDFNPIDPPTNAEIIRCLRAEHGADEFTIALLFAAADLLALTSGTSMQVCMDAILERTQVALNTKQQLIAKILAEVSI